MHQLQTHVRNTFLAGIFAIIPLAVTGFIIYKVDEWTRGISSYLFGRPIPLVGVLIAIGVVYVVGLVATVSIGKLFIKGLDSLLTRVPGLRQFYIAWKQIAITPGGTEGIFSRVVLIPDETGATHLLGFTCGRPIENQANTLCVFVPAAPNPINGRLYLVQREKCAMVDLTTEEAFKVVLSTGNYVPAQIGAALQKLLPAREATT
ncbi:MAG TPA: DUF502 domain-containing protein, partial [Tepidisphaeraceae bacterium]